MLNNLLVIKFGRNVLLLRKSFRFLYNIFPNLRLKVHHGNFKWDLADVVPYIMILCLKGACSDQAFYKHLFEGSCLLIPSVPSQTGKLRWQGIRRCIYWRLWSIMLAMYFLYVLKNDTFIYSVINQNLFPLGN